MLTEENIFSLLLSDVGNRSLLNQNNFDDAALIHVDETRYLVVSTDFIRGPQFNLAEKGYLSLYDLAHFLVAANTSDIASMGSRPTGFLDVFRYPEGVSSAEQEDFFSGLRSAVDFYGVELVGGDSGSYSEFVLSGTCLGFVNKSNILLRRNLKVGEHLCFAGKLGCARAAQVHFLKNFPNKDVIDPIDIDLINSWKRPSPPLNVGPILSEKGWSAAAQDVSDGLASTIYSMCRESNVGAIIYEDALPISDHVRSVAERSHQNVTDLALATSPDFGILFSTQEAHIHNIKKYFSDLEISVIGEVTDEKPVRILSKKNKLTILRFNEWTQTNFKL